MDTHRVAKRLVLSCAVVLALVLLFRGLVYSHLYIALGDPYGIADIVELLLGLVLIALLVATALYALFLGVEGPRAHRGTAIWLIVVVLIISTLAGPAHTLAAHLASA